jgi:predicted RNA methylase
VVEEDDLVVDIGTGSGILALMAAKAGAQHVFAIEGDPSLERAARKVVAANGRADAVTVVGRHSTQLKVGFGADVPTGADVIVTEIFDSWLLGEGMVPVMHDAVQRGLLARPCCASRCADLGRVDRVGISCKPPTAASARSGWPGRGDR